MRRWIRTALGIILGLSVAAALAQPVEVVNGTQPNGQPIIQRVGSGYPNTTGMPITGSITATNPSVSAAGSAVPSSGTYLAGSQSGTLTGLILDGSSNLDIDCVVGCSGGTFNNNADAVATSATNGQAAAWLYGFNGTTWDRLRSDASKFLKVDLSASNATVTVTGTVTANQGGSNWSINLAQVGGSALALGQTTMSASLPVTLASDQSALAITAASLPLPSGAATAANQTTANTSLASIVTNTTGLAIGSTTSGSTGSIIMGAVTTAAPTYTTAQNDPFSLDTAGNLRVSVLTAIPAGSNDIGSVDQHGNWTARVVGNAGGAIDAAGQNTSSPANELLTGLQFNTTPTTITSGNMSPLQAGNSKGYLGTVLMDAAGNVRGANVNASNQLSVSLDGGTGATVAATESGTWTVQPGNTANTTPWLMTINDGTNSAKVQAASTSPALADKALTVVLSPNPTTACPNFTAINQTTSTDVKTFTNFGYICQIKLVSATAQSLSVAEGTGTVCATSETFIDGGSGGTNALAANGGWVDSFGANPLKLAASGDHLCILQSSTGNVSGFVQWADHA